MNKKLICLPILAFTMCGLASCGGETENYNGNAHDVPDVKPSEERQKYDHNEPEEFGGYKRITRPEDGKDYLIGFYQYNLGEMRFMNGLPHIDEGITYPYYFGTNAFKIDAKDSKIDEDAVFVHIDYIKDESGNPTDEFTIKVLPKEGKELDAPDNYYANKYFQLYGDEKQDGSQTKIYTSLRCGEIGSTYGNSNEFVTSSNWTFVEKYAYKNISYEVNAIVVKNFVNGLANQSSDYSGLIGLGTHDDYFTIEAERSKFLMDSMICHFWEKKTTEEPPAENPPAENPSQE